MKLGLDVDGCLAGWTFSVVREHARWFGSNINHDDITYWDAVMDLTGMSARDLFAWCREAQVYERAKPIPGALGVISWLASQGHEIHFVTHRPDWCVDITIDWLTRWLGRTLPVIDLTVVHVLSGTKSAVPCDLYLDDGPHVLEELTGQGLLAVRFEQPWNAELDRKHYAASVPSWHRFAKTVEALS
jgi:5'(3')-deoxyribonucleotidase